MKYISMYIASAALFGAASSFAVPDLDVIDRLEEPLAEHCTQQEINAISNVRRRFTFTFECGRRLFDTRFNILDGGGGNVGNGKRYSGVPRADLNGSDQWANHFPQRRSGPDGEACSDCHEEPLAGAGASGLDIVSDPLNSGNLSDFIQRNTTSMLGAGPLQLLAEEMTSELIAIRERARRTACNNNRVVRADLQTKGVEFGFVRVACNPRNDDTRRVAGVNDDLIIRPFGWKGNQMSLRSFNRGAGHNDIGVQAAELVGVGVDGDFDGVTNELFIGDMTGLAIYLAGQPRPVTRLELADLGLLQRFGQEPLRNGERASIRRGAADFRSVGCESCHRASMTIDNTIYSEPSQTVTHRDETFPSGLNPLSVGVNPNIPVSFDVTRDVIENRIRVGNQTVALGNLQRNSSGQGVLNLFGDLKRHEMGPELAEAIPDFGVGNSTWITKELWGVGSNGPYLHDGRASTLTEAIIAHGGEAAASQRSFLALSRSRQNDIITFLNNLILVREESN
ncbi:di-heme oxidoredictase family protein [Agarilytica rhodophyticola]|uniref:di-heme oxidoredictase family protein n=1 Tax=Agarilytica rhodophyticola TaxID=1737490 RepID=UPI000B343315|nr:di-heme oxidoredictase family protein [Agarilytica rhodophyticola]